MYFPEDDETEESFEPLDLLELVKRGAGYLQALGRLIPIPYGMIGKKVAKPLIKSSLAVVEPYLHNVVAITSEKLTKAVTVSDKNVCSFAISLGYHLLYSELILEPVADVVEDLKEAVSDGIGTGIASVISTDDVYEDRSEQSSGIASWASWMYGGLRDSIGAIAGSCHGQKVIEGTCLFAGVLTNYLTLSYFVDQDQDLTPQYVLTSILYMRIAAFLSLVAKKGIIEVAERCKEYHVNRQAAIAMQDTVIGEEAELEKYLQSLIKTSLLEMLPALKDDEEEIKKLVVVISAEGDELDDILKEMYGTDAAEERDSSRFPMGAR